MGAPMLSDSLRFKISPKITTRIRIRSPVIETTLTTTRLVSSLPTDEPVFREIVVEYLEEVLTDLRQAPAAGELERVAQLAHSLKGAGGSAGFAAFTAPSQELQLVAPEGDQSVTRGADLFGRSNRRPGRILTNLNGSSICLTIKDLVHDAGRTSVGDLLRLAVVVIDQ